MGLTKKQLKEMLRPLVREALNEVRYPPKAVDLNKIKNADGFWGWSIAKAAQESGLHPIQPPFKVVADIIMWLNMAAGEWERGHGRMLEGALKESSDKEFRLNPQQYQALGDLVGKFGGNIEDITEQPLYEKESPEYLTMPSADIEKSGAVVAVDKSILDGLDEFIKAGMEAKDWYTDMNKKILATFGDSDGTLMLMLLALFSPQNNLTTNFRLAAQVYIGIKKDLADPSKQAEWTEMVENPKLYNALKVEDKYKGLGTIKGLLSGTKFVNTFIPNLQRTLRLYKQNGYKFSRQAVVQELSKHLKKSSELGKDTTISAEKVFSFTLNLLDPSYQFEWGWMPVTIDTWMASFFYPAMGKKEKSALLGKSKNYAYMAKLTAEQAQRYGMKPHELQAIIWVAMIRKSKGENYNVTFENAIAKNLQRLKVEKTEIQKMSGLLDKVVSVIGGA